MNPPMLPPMPPIPPTYATTNHVLHLVLTLITCGVWAFIWPCVYGVNTLMNSSKRTAYERALVEYQRQAWMYDQQRQAL